MKYVRSSDLQQHSNGMAVTVDEQVYYKAVRDIQPRDEMLLYARDVLYPEIDLDTVSRHKLLTDNQTYPCGTCGELFKSNLALRRHETYGCLKNSTNHNSNPNYLLRMTALDAQQLGDSDGKSMDSETSAVEPENGLEGEFKCDQCPKSFQWKSNLSRHQITHDEDKRYPCENCDKVFTDPSNLQRHIRSQHVGARCHACSDCGKTFATSSGLKQHQHIHSSIKPFQCEVCLKAYTQFSNLCRHKRMHADCRQQIKCKDCGQAFSTVTSLTKHRRFCEGIRSGMRMCYPQADKLPMTSLSPGSQHPPHAFNPAYLNLYGPRPFHPFFPPLGGHAFPLLQSALPPGMLGPSSLSPSGSLGSNGVASESLSEREGKRSRSPTSEEDEDRMLLEQEEDMSRRKKSVRKREADEVAMSDEETEKSPSKKLKREPGEVTPPRCRSPYRARHGGRTASPKGRCSPPPSHSSPIRPPTKPALSQPTLLPSPIKVEEASSRANMPFDLSVKTERESPPASHCSRKMPTPRAALSDAPLSDAPLDLSITKKSPNSSNNNSSGNTSFSSSDTANKNNDSSAYARLKKELGDVEDSRVRSSVFSKKPFVPEPRYPFHASMGFGFPCNPRFMETLMRSRMTDGKGLQLPPASYPEELSKFLFPRFSLLPSSYTAGFNPLHMLRHDMSEALADSLNPQLKMDKPGGEVANHSAPVSLPHPFPYGSQQGPASGNAGGAGLTAGNKLKERYSCKFCGKIFPRSANLTRHLRTHTGEQPYKCKYCDRSFSISSNLQRHVRNIHNKEKPFRCPLCDRSFGQQTNLDRHLKKHEQEGPNVSDSPTAELDTRDDPASYYHEIRNLFARNLDPASSVAAAAAGASTDSPPGPVSPRPCLPGLDVSDVEDEKQSDVTVVEDVDDEVEKEAVVDKGEGPSASRKEEQEVNPVVRHDRNGPSPQPPLAHDLRKDATLTQAADSEKNKQLAEASTINADRQVSKGDSAVDSQAGKDDSSSTRPSS